MGKFEIGHTINVKPRTAPPPPPVPNCKWVPLTRQMFALVDDCVFERVMEHFWQCSPKHKKSKTNYAVTRINYKDRSRLIGLHEFLWSQVWHLPDTPQIDHRNGDGLIGTFNNLRAASQSQNQHNRGIQNNNRSGFKGVGWLKANQKWRARIKVNGKSKLLGYWDDPELAYAAYCKAAVELHLDFARVK